MKEKMKNNKNHHHFDAINFELFSFNAILYVFCAQCKLWVYEHILCECFPNFTHEFRYLKMFGIRFNIILVNEKGTTTPFDS